MTPTLDVLKKAHRGLRPNATEMLSTNCLPFVGRMLKFHTPAGHEMRLFAKKETGRHRCRLHQPGSLAGRQERRRRAHWLDHVLLMATLDPEKGINQVAECTKIHDGSAGLLSVRAGDGRPPAAKSRPAHSCFRTTDAA